MILTRDTQRSYQTTHEKINGSFIHVNNMLIYILKLHRVPAKQIVHFVATKESASPTIRMIACDASVVVNMQESLVVSDCN